jgi:exonuclease VII small subunit
MTHFETSRIREMIGIKIGLVQQAAQRLSPALELEQLEEGVADLEKGIAELKDALTALPYKRTMD